MHLPRCWCADRRCRLPRVHRFAAAHASGCHPEAGPAGTLERTETAPPSAILAECRLPNQTSSPPCQYHRLLLSHLLTSITNTTCNMSTHNPNSPKNDQQDSAKLRPVTKASFPYQLVMSLSRLRASQLLARRSLAFAPYAKRLCPFGTGAVEV